MKLVKAPWTADQVASLNEYQESGVMHPFTCGGRTLDGEEHVLRATEEGWVCDKCPGWKLKAYHQDWCHWWMSDWSWKKWMTPEGAVLCR